MAQLDKIQVAGTSYNVAQNADATFAGTSNDTASPTAWTDVAVLASGEKNSSIFTKISTMFKNIRYLYRLLGTTDFSGTGATTVTAALANLQSNKAASTHSHQVGQLPVTSQQTDSASYIPTSALIYSMNQTLTSLNTAFNNLVNVRLQFTGKLSIYVTDNPSFTITYITENFTYKGTIYNRVSIDFMFSTTNKIKLFLYKPDGNWTQIWTI